MASATADSAVSVAEELTAAAEAAGLDLEQFRYTMLARRQVCPPARGVPRCLTILRTMQQHLLPAPVTDGAAATL